VGIELGIELRCVGLRVDLGERLWLRSKQLQLRREWFELGQVGLQFWLVGIELRLQLWAQFQLWLWLEWIWLRIRAGFRRRVGRRRSCGRRWSGRRRLVSRRRDVSRRRRRQRGGDHLRRSEHAGLVHVVRCGLPELPSQRLLQRLDLQHVEEPLRVDLPVKRES
jgi:hypothetical protein